MGSVFGQETIIKNLKIKCVQEIPFLDELSISVDNLEDAKIELKKIYDMAINQSYLAFSVDTVFAEASELIARVHLGAKYEMDDVHIEISENSSSIDGEVIEPKFAGKKMRYKELFSEDNYLLRWYENNGYPFASISLEEVEENRIKINLNPGDYYEIDSLIIKGYKEINQRIVLNRIGVQIGDAYDESLISQIDKKIGDINHLTLERSPEVLFSNEKAVLYLFLKKKANNRLNALIGLLPNEDGKVEFTGNFELQLSNALGADEFLGFNWRRLEQGTQDLNIDFSYPYLFNLKVGMEQNLSIYKHDTTYTEVKSRSSLQYLFDRFNFVRFFIQSRTYNSLLSNTELGSDPESSILQYGIGGQISSLDYRFNPRKGINAKIDFALGDKKLQGVVNDESDGAKDNAQLTIEGEISHYQPIAKRSVIKSSINFAHIESEFVIDNELYRLGGIKSIRGFDEEAFNASSMGVGTIEYRYLTDRNSYFSMFTDYAQFERKTIQSTSITTGSALGIGLGAAFETKAGIFSLSYALGRLDGDAFLLRSGKVHFGFNALF